MASFNQILSIAITALLAMTSCASISSRSDTELSRQDYLSQTMVDVQRGEERDISVLVEALGQETKRTVTDDGNSVYLWRNGRELYFFRVNSSGKVVGVLERESY